MNINSIVLEKLSIWKNEKNITNRDLAKKLGVTDALVGQYLNGKKQLPNTRFQQVAKILGVTLEELLAGEEPYKIHLRGKISNFSGQLGIDRVISRIEENYL